MSYYSYFSGPNGSNTVSSNNWGQGVNSGDDRIYGLNPKTENLRVNDFRGKTYFYDQSQYNILINVTNNASVPVDDDVVVQVILYNSTYTIFYAFSGQSATAGSITSFDMSLPTTPIIAVAYWFVTFTTTGNFTGSAVDISINGNPKVSSGTLNPPGTPTAFDSTVYSTEEVNGTGLTFDITIN
jgi:hypothetical protein